MTGDEFDSFFNEVDEFVDDLMRITAQSAIVCDSIKRIRTRRVRPKIRAYRRAPRAPDRQWCSPIWMNAPPRGLKCR